LKLLIVANSAEWKSWPQKIETLQKWFAWKVNFDVDLEHTSYSRIPFSEYGPAAFMGVDPVWYDDHVARLATGYDIVLFVVPVNQWYERNKARGWRYDNNFGPIELQIACDEQEHLYQNGQDLGETFYQYARHEILHALYMLTGQEDRTHFYWDQGKLEGALLEIQFPQPHMDEQIALLQRLIDKLMELVGLKRKLIEVIESGPPLNPTPPMPPKKPTVRDFALAIQEYEGYYAPGQHAKHPNGTLSWRNRNPGNIRYAGQKRAIGKDKLNFAIFKSYEDGFATLVEMIVRAVQGKSTVYAPTMSIMDYFKKYAPSADNNNPDAYAKFVADKLKVSPTTKINTLVIS
jgi:hypothetical protein